MVKDIKQKICDAHHGIKKYYEEWWENPLDPRSFIFQSLNKLVFERLPIGKGKTALDVGSGKGTIVSLLCEKAYQVTSVELNEKFCSILKRKFPEIEVIKGDFNSISINCYYDIVSAIEFIQNLDRKSLNIFFKKVASLTDNFILNISNKNSLHGKWVAFRGFQNSFVYTYTPYEIEKNLEELGFQVTYKKGIGILTPITLFPNFRFKIIPIWLAKSFNSVGDILFPEKCHLYYIEAKK